MPRFSHGMHTADSLRHIAATLKEIAAQIDGTAVLMELPPVMAECKLPMEQGQLDGIAWLQQWADKARNAVREGKHAVIRGVSDSELPVSDPRNGTANHKVSERQSSPIPIQSDTVKRGEKRKKH